MPVTEDLNANMSGYLAIHCIYQLLKSRAFSKYKVPIKVSKKNGLIVYHNGTPAELPLPAAWKGLGQYFN